jgi:histone H3/H4
MAKDRNMTEEEANAEFIRQLGGGPEAYEDALREAEAQLKKAGQPADMLTMDRMAREAIDRARSQVNPEAVQAANRWADRIVLQQEPEGVGKLISSLIRAIQGLNIAGFPLGQMLVPFNKIVSNLFEQALDYTGLGLVRGIIGMHISDARIKWDEKGVPGFAPADNARMFSDVERRERAMAGFLGLTLSAAAYLAAKANMDDDDDEVPFMIYAFGPTDKNKREQMPDGWVPFSIKVGDTYYRYAEWPLGMVLAGFGAALDAERYGNMKEKDTMERIGYSAMLGLKGFMTQGVLSNVDTAIDVLMFKATGKKYTDIPVNAAKGVIPAQGFLRDISGVFDNTKISNDDITSALIRDLPFVKSLGTRPELNVFGEPTLVEGEAILRRFLTERRPHAEADYLSRNKLYIPGMDETVTIGQYLPPTERDRFKRRAMQMAAMENGVFTPEQNYNFRKRAGELTKAAVQRIMKAAPAIRTEEQRKAVQNLIEKQVGLARRRAMVEAVPYEAPR